MPSWQSFVPYPILSLIQHPLRRYTFPDSEPLFTLPHLHVPSPSSTIPHRDHLNIYSTDQTTCTSRLYPSTTASLLLLHYQLFTYYLHYTPFPTRSYL
ncbi:hypothetical protein T265_07058 [Opisthorchis viverrini]|uniref:Uncharacterized protein n=1 Tax=Opisthorchis viverrini TaxID=6198 RepID=A0A074ZE91_OPIVI|nr:hypothetical protein T265_07058 [Opisthorchis viverrini]KER25488.1 hypothetical protein T265_07058 [Opisthorchis viverrini]